MKKFKLFTIALAALALAACSSDDVTAPSGSGNTGFGADGTGYLKLSINLPTQSAGAGTRAANDQTDDGDASEYAVNDATLLLFKGADQNAATFQAAYDMTLNWNQGLDDDQITSQGTKVQKINSITAAGSEKIYALVVLNRNSVFTVDNAANTIKFGQDVFSGSFKDFTVKTVASASALTGNGYFMTNAVMTDKPGSAAISGQTTTILADVSDKIYQTELLAQQNPAADIFVERAVAKVQLTQSINSNELTVGSNKLTYAISGWALANKNTSSYIVRNWNQSAEGITPSGDAWYALTSDGDGLSPTSGELTSNPYRFAGYSLAQEESGNPATAAYRTYFGIDPNYNTDATFTDAPASASGMTFDSNTKYCLENTFDVAHQNVKNTTCAIIKAKFTLPAEWRGTDFYTVNDIRTTIYKESEAKNAILKQAGDLYNNAILATATSDDEFEGATKINVAPKAVTYTVDADTKNLKLTKVTFTATEEGGDATTKDYDLNAEQLEAVQNAITVTQYTNAEAYYTVLIKHFGDELTPWNRATKTTAAYPDDQQQANKNWLGRYGVLRNNWYEIEVNGVSAIGSATVPSVNTDTTPDDEVENYISVKINLLSWAKRKQSVTLQ